MKTLAHHHALPIAGLALWLLAGGLARAGTLSDFSHDAAKSMPPPSTMKAHGDTDAMLEGVGPIFGIVFVGVAYGGIESWNRMSSDDKDPPLRSRMLGEAMLPFLRLDAGYQSVRSDVDAWDWRAEGGYGPIGVHVNHTRYRETEPADTLDLVRVFGLYRMSFGSLLEVDLGLGALTMDSGKGENSSSFAVTLPVLLHPWDFAGLEFRPAWAHNVSDYDLALVTGWRFASVKAGYRWVRTPSYSLDGPYAALCLKL
jgi:hypothetical protein